MIAQRVVRAGSQGIDTNYRRHLLTNEPSHVGSGRRAPGGSPLLASTPEVPMSREIEIISAAIEGVVATLASSVVSVHSHRMEASGFVWRPGLIVTSDEGLAEEGNVHVTLPGGERVAGQVVGRDPSTAIALLKVERSD